MLSVIVPVYNAEQYLSRCIESILDQTYKHLEVILIDDGSTDRSPQICDKYAQMDNRVQVIHKKNEGLVRARKDGLRQASGNYIAFVDNDDWIEKDMYKNLLEILDSSGADFVDSGCFYDKDSKSYIDTKLKNGGYELDKWIRHGMFLALLNLESSFHIRQHIWSKVFKATLIKSSYANVPDKMQGGEDIINIIHGILLAKKIVQIEDVFYHYNYREESLSHLKTVSYMKTEFEIWNYCGNIILNHDEFMKQEDIDQCLFRKWYSSFHYLLNNEFDVIQYYSFPHIEKLFGKRIVIYGAGNVGKDYITQISKYEKCQIVCWVDKDFDKMQFPYRTVVSVEQLLENSYDIVLIAVEKGEVAEEIRQFLLQRGVLPSRILWCAPNTFFN